MIGHVQTLGIGRFVAAQETLHATRCARRTRRFAVAANLHADHGWQQNWNSSKAALESATRGNGLSDAVSGIDVSPIAVPNSRRKE